MSITYYPINEEMARTAHDMNSMRDYRENEKTDEYKRKVDKAYQLGAERKEQYPECAEKIYNLCDKYAKQLADWYNESFRVEAMCPSVFISGGANFPVRKKEKQNARRDSMNEKWKNVESILDRISSCGSEAIQDNDSEAIEKLKAKIKNLTDVQETMKKVNAYYRKNKTLDGCPFVTPEELSKLQTEMASGFHLQDAPFESFTLSNNNANIHRLKERLAKLEKIKETGTKEINANETGVEGITVVKNAEAMRIQLIFEGKPDEKTRNLLKHNGFRWSPRYNAWQRNLNSNGEYAVKMVLKTLKETGFSVEQ